MKIPINRKEAFLLLALGDNLGECVAMFAGELANEFYQQTGRAEDETWLLGLYLKIKAGLYDHLIYPRLDTIREVVMDEDDDRYDYPLPGDWQNVVYYSKQQELS